MEIINTAGYGTCNETSRNTAIKRSVKRREDHEEGASKEELELRSKTLLDG